MKNLSAKPEFSEPNKIKIILLVFQSSIILYKIRILTTNEENLGKLRFFNFVQWCPRHWTYNYFDLLKGFSRQCEKALSAPVSRTHPSHLGRVWLESSECGWELWVCWKVFECGGYECECVKLSVQWTESAISGSARSFFREYLTDPWLFLGICDWNACVPYIMLLGVLGMEDIGSLFIPSVPLS